MRRGVCARTAAACTVPPAERMARTASASVDPVVTTSSTSTNARPSSRRAGAIDQAEFARRASRPRLAWSTRPAVVRSTSDARNPAWCSSNRTGS